VILSIGVGSKRDKPGGYHLSQQLRRDVGEDIAFGRASLVLVDAAFRKRESLRPQTFYATVMDGDE
jgi:hypothetical protein